jgi:16S rRNA G966 N2-methylase RsmD
MEEVLRIDEELHDLIPPLTAEEYRQLEENIIAEGCRDALVVWNDTIIDGHNRYEICTQHGIEFNTVGKEFENKDVAKVWIIDNQKGRRNLTDGWKYELAQERKKILLERGKKNQGARTDLLSPNDKKLEHNTQKEIASELGWSTGKTAQADYVWKHGDEKIKEKIKQGEESFNSAYKVISKENRTKEIAEERQKIAESAKAISNTDRWNIHQADIRTWQADKHYDYIITDPPYPKEFLPLYEVLAERASGWLRPGGLLIAMCGQSYLNQIYEIMSRHMDYYWTACYHTPGQPTPLRQVNVNTTWKPLLIFTARDQTYKGKIFGDVFKSDGNDKDFHKWGQSVSGMSDIIKKICIPGQYILDPFCGAGTTGIAAIKNGCLFDGVDIDQENVNIAKGRLNDTKEE